MKTADTKKIAYIRDAPDMFKKWFNQEAINDSNRKFSFVRMPIKSVS